MNAEYLVSEYLACLAQAAERMNEFARTLWSVASYSDVHFGADLGMYGSEWRFEKWVELYIDRNAGQVAAWFIEVFFEDGRWKIASSLSISHSPFYIDLETREAQDLTELRNQLHNVITELESSFQSGKPLRVAAEEIWNRQKLGQK